MDKKRTNRLFELVKRSHERGLTLIEFNEAVGLLQDIITLPDEDSIVLKGVAPAFISFYGIFTKEMLLSLLWEHEKNKEEWNGIKFRET